MEVLLSKEEMFKNSYSHKLHKLKELLTPMDFSSSHFYFKPTKRDWEIIKRKITTVQLYITNRCNSFCKICFRKSSYYDFSQEMSKKDIIKILRKIGKRKRVILIGGEPTIREDLFEIIKLIKKSGNYPELFTNGLKLANPEYVKRLKDCGIKRVYLSFDGFRKNIYTIMNGNENELTLKLLALKNLEIFGIDVILSVRVVKNLNENEVKKIIEFCIVSAKRNSNIRGVYFYGATPYGRFLLKGATFSGVELHNLLNKITNGVASLEYFIELEKLYLNLHKFLSKFGINISFGSGGLIGIFKTGSIKRAFSIKFLKRINKKLENKKYFSFLFDIVRNRITRRALFNFFIKKDVIKSILLPRYFLLGFGEVNTPTNYKSMIVDNIGFEKYGRSLIVNIYGYSASYMS